ncbi:pentapeptide repeat-containing protein [Sphingobacterium lactis]|uniref:pentapeptide repeat-containing protein n=1 Tax=Sphingobacterium lactis TaxID=797291 RepID=UPI003F7D0567
MPDIPYFVDQDYKQLNASDLIEPAEYEYCRFENCNLEKANLSSYKFVDCTFKHCNLSLATIEHAMFQDCKFQDCKLLGLRFDSANQFNLSFSFESSILDHSSFYNCKIKNTLFQSCKMHEVDFESCDLSQAKMSDCDLLHASFVQTNLEKADLSSSFNIQLDPENNRLKGAKFSSQSLAGLLTKYKIVIKG